MSKKIPYHSFFASALVALASCTSGLPDSDNPQSGMEVTFLASESTRSSLVTNTTIRNESFAVYGEMNLSSSSASPTVIFDGTEVAYNGSAWAYADVQYWLPLHTYSFAAIHPYSALQSNITDINFDNSSLSFTYNYPSNYSDAIDMLAATHRRYYTAGTAHPVAFNFVHIMARLNFVVNVDPSLGSSVKIQNIRLKNICKTGSYLIAPAPLQSGETDDYIGGNWTESEDNMGELFNIATDVTIANGSTYEIFPSATNPLLIIPQRVSDNVELEVIFQKDGDAVSTTASAQLYNTTVTAHNGVWRPGRAYTYKFSIGADDYIIFGEPSIQDWNEAEGGNYIISN